METGEVALSVICRGGAAAVIVVAAGNSDTVDSCMVTFSVVVLQSVVAEVGAVVAVGATWSRVDVGNSEAVVEEVVGSVGVM